MHTQQFLAFLETLKDARQPEVKSALYERYQMQTLSLFTLTENLVLTTV